VMSMLASLCVTASITVTFLFTGELSPTTHRGMISSGSRIFAAICAIFGPLVSAANLTTSQRLGLFGTLAASGALVSLLLPETRGRAIPATAKDVHERRMKQRILFTRGLQQNDRKAG
jgi:hypothetical protein